MFIGKKDQTKNWEVHLNFVEVCKGSTIYKSLINDLKGYLQLQANPIPLHPLPHLLFSIFTPHLHTHIYRYEYI